MDAQPQRRFKFNYSHLKNFESCPRRHYEVDILRKWKKDGESDQLKYGKLFHKAIASRLGRLKMPMPDRLGRYEALAEAIEAFPLKGKRTSIESELAFTNQFQSCDPDAEEEWFKCKIDVLMIAEPNAIILDFKTGERKEKYIDWLQLALYASAVFYNFPEVQKVGVSYIWVGDPIIKDPREFTREDMVNVWNGIFARLQPFMMAQETKHYPERENPFCSAWCPVIDCQHNGRR